MQPPSALNGEEGIAYPDGNSIETLRAKLTSLVDVRSCCGFVLFK